MISIWDMIVGSGYPGDKTNHAYIGIGIGIFSLSFLIALMTLPLLIYLIEKYYTQLLKLTRGGRGRLDRDRNYEYDYYRIIISFLFGACILILLIVIMSTHGLYFLYKISIYIDYLHEIDHEFQKSRLTYVIPSSHYILYFLEAAYEAAEENLILWGFLFLVNLICQLTVKRFYFKIFTMVLSIRVVFVFACHFNIWELLVNTVCDSSSVHEAVKSNIRGIALAMYPFHTIAKALRVLEILCSLIVFIPFALYIRRLIAQKLVECNLRDENNGPEERIPLRGYNNLGRINAKEKIEIEFAKKYLRGYIVFLVIHLILNLLECHFISLIVYRSTHNGNNAVLIVEMVTSVITDILAFAPSFLFLLFITYFVYSTTKGVQEDGETEQHQKYRYKRYTLTGLIILFCSLFCTGFIGYLRFTDGDSILIELKNYDYILLNESRKTDLSEFIDSCDQVEFSNYSRNKLTEFDFLTLYYASMEGNLNLKDINFYEDYDEIPYYINESITSKMPDYSTRMWFPANTCLHDIKVDGDNSINYTLTPIHYPCYYTQKDGSVNDGLRVMCSGYEEREKLATILFCTTNTSNSCCIPNDSMITNNGLAVHSFTANRPRYKGKNAINNLLPIIKKKLKNFLIEFIQPQVNVSIGYREHIRFFMTCLHNNWWATGILLLIFVIMGIYLSLCFVCLSKLLSSCFV